ncbi:MAG: hypothetical protein D6696_00750 [Acidobacteria bacterium]|nr:MAG: hypothetical protein D6696_00750 [Acidobacteriota bacterium]
MAHTYEEIKNKTVAQLREMAQGMEHDALRGYSTMHKDELVHAMCVALGLEEHVHHEVVGIDKRKVKAQIRALKVERNAALEARDKKRLKSVRRRLRALRRKIKKATV